MSTEEFPQKQEGLDMDKELLKERVRLSDNADLLNSGLAEVEASSPTRAEKISDFIDRNWFTVMGGSLGIGGAWGLGEGMVSGQWERIAIGLGVGAGVGKALEIVAKRAIKKSKK